jgi:AraC-like DNA-binding protein
MNRSTASVFIEPVGILATAPAAVQRVFAAMHIHSRDPKLPFRSRMSFIGDVVFSRIEAGGHVDLEWIDHDPAVRDSYHWLVFSSSGLAKADTSRLMQGMRELAVYDGSSLPDTLHLSGMSRNLIVMIPSDNISPTLPIGQPIAADYGAGAVLAALARTMEAQAYSGGSIKLQGFVPILIDAMTRAFEQQSDPTFGAVPADMRMSRIIDHIELHLDDPDLSAPFTARACGVSLRQLHRLFNATGESFVSTTRRLRLERAVVLLANRNIKIGDIAGDCGFADASYFSTVFTSVYGETPRTRRKRLLNMRETNI